MSNIGAVTPGQGRARVRQYEPTLHGQPRPQNAPAGFGRGLNLGGDGKGGPDRWVTTGRVRRDRDRALLRRGPEENQAASAPAMSPTIMLWWNYCAAVPAVKRASGLLASPGFTDRQRTPLYRPAECGTVPAAVLFCCAVSW